MRDLEEDMMGIFFMGKMENTSKKLIKDSKSENIIQFTTALPQSKFKAHPKSYPK
jgi:hypothetical protein